MLPKLRGHHPGTPHPPPGAKPQISPCTCVQTHTFSVTHTFNQQVSFQREAILYLEPPTQERELPLICIWGIALTVESQYEPVRPAELLGAPWDE